MYELFFILSDPNTASLRLLEQAIVAEYASHNDSIAPRIINSGERLAVEFEGFSFLIDLNCGSSVQQECDDAANNFAAEHPQKALIAGSRCRFELSSDDDFEMDYFNDLMFLSTAAESLGGVFTFDARQGEFQ